MLVAIVSLLCLAPARAAPADMCSAVTQKQDCGFVGIDQSGCEQKGCCWQPASSNEPWCFFKAQSSSSCFAFPSTPASEPPFSSDQIESMKTLFLKNIGVQGTGAVVAAPDPNTPGGSYYYHWERDGALTMTALQLNAQATTAQLLAYAEWVAARQAMADPHSIDVRTEPKYEIPSGAVYDGAWCRPQNDGPGLRAIALLLFAERLMASGNATEIAYVKSKLWRDSADGVIQQSLKYLTDGGWLTDTCDLWEEVRSADFFWNRATMKRALEKGADFDAKFAGGKLAATYRQLASQIGAALSSGSHFANGYIFESTNRPIDGAVIVALNMGFDDPSPTYTPAADQVASTVLAYNYAFCNEYPINTADSAAAVPGVLYGRYPGDHYAGGNPWVLTSAALAQLLYRVAHAAAEGAALSAAALADWAKALNTPMDAASAAKKLLAAGDAVLARVQTHVKADGGRLDEQIDKNTGKQVSAKSLTWSYAEVLNALHWRAQAKTAVAKSVVEATLAA
ncbi:hypothetical protein AB1Y20_008508 [Prymnesium parvum]|uniref:glucan 1,4-alpha-glucosidase n=1 Tax=Prymnesium parvum TaxID=97485 RepID=A0AB34IUR5_PRYPA